VLGELFEGQVLRDLLVDAIRYGEQPEKRAGPFRKVDGAVDVATIERLVAERKLTSEGMDPNAGAAIREEMERAQARRLQPHFIGAFFRAAFAVLGGRIVKRERGRFEIARTPSILKERDRLIGRADPGTAPRLLVYLEHAIPDGRVAKSGEPRVVSQRLQFIHLGEDGTAADGGSAPYLDCRPLTAEERATTRSWPRSMRRTPFSWPWCGWRADLRRSRRMCSDSCSASLDLPRLGWCSAWPICFRWRRAGRFFFCQLVDDPSAWPEHFATEEAQDAEAKRMHRIIEMMVPCEAPNDQEILNAARWAAARSVAWGMGEEPPAREDARAILDYLQTKATPVYDPFCGGGSIPLVSSFPLSTKEGKKAWVEPVIDPTARDGYRFEVTTGTLGKAAEERLKRRTNGEGRSNSRCSRADSSKRATPRPRGACQCSPNARVAGGPAELRLHAQRLAG
jgi:hypothetical protein